MREARETYAKIMVFDVRRIPDEVLRTMLFDETTKYLFHLYPQIAYVPTDVYRSLNIYDRTIWSHYLGLEAISRDEPHLKHWKDLTNVDINLGIERFRYQGKLKEPNPYSEGPPRQKNYHCNPLLIDT